MKAKLGLLFMTINVLYYRYCKQVLRCNLFDEYFQMHADELVKETEHLLFGDHMKKWFWSNAVPWRHSSEPTDSHSIMMLLSSLTPSSSCRTS